MKGPQDIPLTDEEQAQAASIIAKIEGRAAEGGAWPALFGPVRLNRRVFEAVLKELTEAGWDAEFTSEGMLAVNGARV
jgi:hypothetical protein